MDISRRNFLFLTVGAAVGCRTVDEESPGSGSELVIDAGSSASYAAEGVYSDFRDHGFFLIRQNGRLLALSSFCTHQKCKLTARPDHSFFCKCHGSVFDPDGKVTRGPARRDLPSFTVSASDPAHVRVTLPPM